MLRLARVREAASKNRKQSFTALLHHVTPELLESSFYGLKRQAASGVDGITWQEYSENLEDKIVDLHNRIQCGSYRPKPAAYSGEREHLYRRNVNTHFHTH